MGFWSEIVPRTKKQKGGWKFAHYLETPSERDDGKWLDALYFRDEGRETFGKLEFLGVLEKRDWRAIATKIYLDREFRERLLSSDPELRKAWKRR